MKKIRIGEEIFEKDEKDEVAMIIVDYISTEDPEAIIWQSKRYGVEIPGPLYGDDGFPNAETAFNFYVALEKELQTWSFEDLVKELRSVSNGKFLLEVC